MSRTQSVRVGMQHPEHLAYEFGVPQGSVLGPLLFTLYMSSVANVIESFGVRHMQYFDDTTLRGSSLEDANTVPVLSDCFRAAAASIQIYFEGAEAKFPSPALPSLLLPSHPLPTPPLPSLPSLRSRPA